MEPGMYIAILPLLNPLNESIGNTTMRQFVQEAYHSFRFCLEIAL